MILGRLCAAAVAGLALGAAGGGAPALAHHSFAMFDYNNRITLAGTVVSFQWTNPHAFIDLAVPDGAAVKHYTVECASPNVLTRIGWKFNTLKAGDKVTLLINPLKSGQPGGLPSVSVLPSLKVACCSIPPGGKFD